MELSRKRKRELGRLKDQAEQLWDDQKQVLEHANRVVHDAQRQTAAFAREEVSPRLREGIAATRSVASGAREKLVDDVFPAVMSALGSALAVLEVAKDPRVRAAIGKVSALRGKAAPAVSKSAGPGHYILIGLGVVAVAGIAFAAWQTLRADDELWIDDEPEDLEAP